MTKDQLIGDIRATFPNMILMLREHCITEQKVWMLAAEDAAKMADGLPIFSEWFYGKETHDGGVHVAFTAWLESRGFYLENHDGFWHYPVPLPTAQEIAEWRADFAIGAAKESSRTGKSPDADWIPF